MKRAVSFFLGSLLAPCCLFATDPGAGSIPTPSAPQPESTVLGGGCFWCLDAAYRLVPGVLSVECGYAGGRTRNPDYREVCTGETGHAEVVRIRYDPSQVTLARLFDLFWKVHDPTTKDRQGHDVGTQYRSIVLYSSQAQKLAAESAIAKAGALFGDPVVTEVVPLSDFWRAEEYHQDYFTKNPSQGYCQAVVRVKVDKMRRALSGTPGH